MLKKTNFVLLFMLATICLFAETKPVVVVVPFDAKGVSRDEVDVISEVFLSEYVSTGVARVVDRNSFDKIAKEHQFQLSEWSDSNKVAVIGKSLNAQMVIVSQVAQFGSQVVFTNRCVDVNTQEIISSSVKRVASVDRLFDECQKMAKELAEKTKVSLMSFPVGSKGGDGGIVFKYEGDYRWEMSKSYNKTDYPYYENWFYGYERCCNPYGYSKLDWYLPSRSDLIQIYNNLIKTGIVKDTNSYDSSDGGFSFENGQTCYGSDCDYVIYIRKFDVKNPNAGPSKDMYNMDEEESIVRFSFKELRGGNRLAQAAQKWFLQSVVFKLTFSSDFTYRLEVTYPIYDVTISGAGLIGRKLNDPRYVNVDYVECSSTEKKTAKGTWCYIRGQSDTIQFGLQEIKWEFGKDYEYIQVFPYREECDAIFNNVPCVYVKNKNGDIVHYGWLTSDSKNINLSCSKD